MLPSVTTRQLGSLKVALFKAPSISLSLEIVTSSHSTRLISCRTTFPKRTFLNRLTLLPFYDGEFNIYIP
jgi:hypothetical protein